MDTEQQSLLILIIHNTIRVRISDGLIEIEIKKDLYIIKSYHTTHQYFRVL